MFSLQAHNQQILFHLSQITPRTHTIRLKEPKSSRKSNKTAQNEYEMLCEQSLCEAVRNFQTSTNTSILELPISAVVMRQKPIAGSQTKTNSAIRSLNRLENTIKMSYVSKDTFRENRAEPNPDALSISPCTTTTPITSHPNIFLLATNLIHQLTNQPMLLRNAMQIRGFRTQRNIESQLKRNPTFLSRIQQAFVPLSKGDPVTAASKQRHETLNKLLATADDGSALTDTEKQRIKVAFAEGYLAANTEDKLGIAAKFVKLLSQVISLALFITLVYLLFSAQGSREASRAACQLLNINIFVQDFLQI